MGLCFFSGQPSQVGFKGNHKDLGFLSPAQFDTHTHEANSLAFRGGGFFSDLAIRWSNTCSTKGGMQAVAVFNFLEVLRNCCHTSMSRAAQSQSSVSQA